MVPLILVYGITINWILCSAMCNKATRRGGLRGSPPLLVTRKSFFLPYLGFINQRAYGVFERSLLPPIANPILNFNVRALLR